MAHEIDMSNGRANAAFARKSAWHNLGVVVPEAMATEDAIRHAGLDWEATLRDVAYMSGEGQAILIEGKRAVVRQDTGKVLGVVGMTYQPVQNRELAAFMDALIGAGAKYDSAGSLYGGKKVWFNVRVADCFEVIPEDIVQPYLTVMNGHDGTTRLTAIATATRVVCANTFQLALDTADRNRTISIRHDGRLMDNVQRAKETLGLVYSAAERYQIEAAAVAKVRLNKEQLAAFFVEQVDMIGGSEDSKKMNMLAMTWGLRNDRNNLRGMEGTAWQAYNVLSEFIDHAPRRTGADKRIESVTMGIGAQQKIMAWNQLLAMAT